MFNDEPNILNCNIYNDEVVHYIKNMPNGKSAGLDGICNVMLKNVSYILTPSSYTAINEYLNICFFKKNYTCDF